MKYEKHVAKDVFERGADAGGFCAWDNIKMISSFRICAAGWIGILYVRYCRLYHLQKTKSKCIFPALTYYTVSPFRSQIAFIK